MNKVSSLMMLVSVQKKIKTIEEKKRRRKNQHDRLHGISCQHENIPFFVFLIDQKVNWYLREVSPETQLYERRE